MRPVWLVPVLMFAVFAGLVRAQSVPRTETQKEVIVSGGVSNGGNGAPTSRTDGDESPETVTYRQWLAPADRIDEWPFGPMRYFPFERRLFDQWIDILKKSSDRTEVEETKHFSRIVLRATLRDLQLVDGRGFLEFPENFFRDEKERQSFGDRSIPLEPWGLWTAPQEDGTASIVCASDGGLRLLLPDGFEDRSDGGVEDRRIHFEWSLRSRPDPRGGLLFDFELPPCLSVELLLDLPVSLIPTSRNGLVLEEPKGDRDDEPVPDDYRRWRVLLGRHSRSSLTISPDGSFRSSGRQTAYQHRFLLYTLAPYGLDVSTTIKFEKADPRVNELQLDVEAPLRIISVKYGDQPVSWTRLASPEPDTRIHIDLSEFAKRETSDLTVLAMSPLPETRPWTLPRIRVASPNLFWKETRCGLHVLRPFWVRDLDCRRAVRVRPRTTIDQSNREVFVFQYFEEDAELSVDFGEHVPEVAASGAVQIQWGGNEVRGNMVLDCSVSEGDRYSLQFPISPNWSVDSVKSVHWTIDSLKTTAGDEVLSWDILDREEAFPDIPGPATSKILSIQLRQPVRPKKSLRIQVTGSFQAASRSEYRLPEFLPLLLPSDKDTTHYIAIQQSKSPYHLQYRAPVSFRPEPDDPAKLRQIQQYIEDASGSVFALDARAREIRLTLERLKPNYSSEIHGTATLKEKELVLDFGMKCLPVDSSVDRVYVHFAPGFAADRTGPETGPDASSDHYQWTWSGNSEVLRPLQVRRVPAKELEELFPASGFRGLLDDYLQGDTWEIRLPVPQSVPFEIRASTSIPLSETVVIPLASLPFSSGQRGDIAVKSPRLFHYQVVNSRLKSIPIPSEKWFRYEETRAAFRYNPREEPRLSLQSPLLLKRLPSEETVPSAWVWSLRLDTQYEPEGNVKNNAIFLIENQGKDKLRIRLPDGVGVGDVHAVWQDDQRETWYPDTESPEDRFYEPSQWIGSETVPKRAEARPPGQLVVVSLPEGARFVTVSLEYSCRDKPLVRQRKLSPRYPSVDVPILSGSWTSWFPPEFDVSLPHRTAADDGNVARQGPRFSKAMDYLLSNSPFDPFSRNDWSRFFHGRKQRQEAETAARIFFDCLATEYGENAWENDPENGFLQDGSPVRRNRYSESWRNNGEFAWGRLLDNEKRLLDRMSELVAENGKGVEVKTLVDRKALTVLGIFSRSPVTFPETSPFNRRGIELFEQAGLVLLVSTKVRPDKVKEYSFHVTSTLYMSLHRHFQAEPIGPRAYYVSSASGLIDSAKSDSRENSQAVSELAGPRWVSPARWLKESESFVLPWSISSQIIRLSSVVPDWNAYEMPQGPDNLLYVVHRKTFAAYHWLAFLAIVVLTARRPLSHPIVLIVLLILFEILTGLVAPCQAGIPGGAFLGGLVSLGFGMVRSRIPRGASSRVKRLRSARSASTHTQFEIGNVSDSADEPPKNDDSTTDGPRLSTLLLPVGIVSLSFILSGELSAETPVLPNRGTGVTAALPLENGSKTVPSPKNGASPRIETSKASSGKSGRFPASAADRREAHRVFFATDRNRNIIGDFVYVPFDFLDLLMKKMEFVDTKPLHHWSIAKAEYHGSIHYNPLTQKLELGDDFTATLDIILGSENATISLPPFPLFRDRATWDSKPVQPIWRTVSDGSSERKVLVFNIENETKGRHRLELALAPPVEPHRENQTNRVEFEIPRVANATLSIKTATETPPITIFSGGGAVRSNTLTSPDFSARIGPVDTLSFSWAGEPDREETATVEVEQHFNLQARPTQIVIWATFAFRIEGGRIRHLNLLTDPRWRLSGQFHCDEHPIETDEKPFFQAGPAGLPSAQNEVVRLAFKEPVSGNLTVSAGFVLRDFNGLGKIRLPQFDAPNALILKSTLAVSADPLLEIDCPETGLMSGYRSGWIAGRAGNNGVTEKMPDDIRASAQREESPLVEYDLTQTEPSWQMAVRTRQVVPKMDLTQAVRFDYGESSMLCRADFFSAADVFLHKFSIPESFRIDAVELRDSQDKPIEIRWSETPERKWNVFFKQAVSGHYSLTIRGAFSTGADLFDKKPSTPKKIRLPMPEFEGVRIGKQTFNAFRTAATIVELSTGGTGWSVSNVAPFLPESFQPASVLGSWIATPEKDETDAALPPPEFSLAPNRPDIRGEQITVLSRPAPDSWFASFDFLWEVTAGELDAIRLRWDEQCSVLSIEPPIPYRLEQGDGQPLLVLTPETPFSGKRHFRIKAALNTSGASVSLPRVDLEAEPEHGTVKRYTVLPRNIDDELIPWSLSMLEDVDPETIRRLEDETSKPIGGNPAEAADELVELSAAPEPKLYFQAVSGDFSAVISRKNALSVASLYDISFVVKEDGVLFGIASIDLKSRGQDSIILRMPAQYEMIQVSCSGIASRGTKLPDNRWKIDLWSSDYPQRLGIIFRGTLRETAESGETVTPGRLNAGPMSCGLSIPVLEGVSVHKTLWTVHFETRRDKNFVPLDVSTVREKEFGVSSFSSPEILGERIADLGRHVPSSDFDAVQTLFKLNLLRLDNLLSVLDQVSAPGSFRSEEIRRWYSHWADQWYGINRILEYLAGHYPEPLRSGRHLFLLDLSTSGFGESGFETTELYLDTKNIAQTLQALTVAYQKNLSAKNFAFDGLAEESRRRVTVSSDSMLYWQDRLTEDTVYLFGISSGRINEIRLKSAPHPYRLSERFREILFPWILLPLFLPFFSRRLPFPELFMQFPHFWGTVAGLLLWCLFPPGYFGIAVLLLTFLSQGYSIWPKHGEYFEQNPG